MPNKKRGRPRKTVQEKPTAPKSSSLLASIRSVKWSESYTSLLMGIVVVIVAVLFVVSILRQSHHIQQTSSIATAITPTITTQPSLFGKTQEKTYTVQFGDDLWSIAEKFYNSGYNWVDIAKANNLSDPSTIHAGNQLIIPSVTPAVATVTPTVTPSIQNSTITGNTYTVKSGDSLWDIAVRAYADGYQWTKIAQANNLANPSLIFSGNVLQIPR